MNSKDIAKIAGVSRSTVSRVINNYSNVPEETRQKVIEVIKKYDYVPQASARMLAGKKCTTLGLVIIGTNEDNYENKIAKSSYFSPLTGAVIDTANKNHYNVLISVINNRAKDFKNAKELFNSKSIFAGIFVGGRNYETEIMDIVERGFKVAVVEQEIKDENDIFNNSLVINGDSFNGAYKAVSYLIGLGHRHIAHITGDLKQYSGTLRLEGYKRALRDNGIEPEASLILKGDYADESGYKAAKKLFSKKRATAIFVGNDTMSLGVMRAAQEMGIKIPADVSIIGYDDIDIASYLMPPLTTVRQSFFEMAQIAANNLIRANEDGTNFYGKYMVPVELIERGSCRKIDA